MRIDGLAEVRVRGDCGHSFAVSFWNMRTDLTCPDCGAVDRIEPRQYAAIEAAFGAALMQASERRDAGELEAVGSAAVQPYRRNPNQ